MSASQNSSTSSAGIPSEYRISKKWDDVIENGVVNVSTGLLVAGLASIVLFRKYTEFTIIDFFYDQAVLSYLRADN